MPVSIQAPTHAEPHAPLLAQQLYRFAIVLTANENLARGLVRSVWRGLGGKPTSHGSLRKMYGMWAAKLGDDPGFQQKNPSEPKLFMAALATTPLAGNAHLAKFIANLPSQQRAVLYLVYGEGASYDEAADIINLNVLALMKLVSRGHVALAHWLDHRGLTDTVSTPVATERAA